MKTKTKTEKELKLEAQIKASNERFQAAPKMEKRVLVAQDAIARAKAGQYVPSRGTWTSITWNYSNPEVANTDEHTEDKSLRTALHDNTVSCECCALGGLMTSCIAFKNRLSIGRADEVLQFDMIDGSGGEIDHAGIKDLFGIKQLCMIENAFERGDGYFSDSTNRGVSQATIDKCIEFGNRFPDSKKRFIAIMQNIVDNKGVFVP